MGLGKTIQCIAAICHAINKGMAGPFLVIAPMSTLENWFNEFKRFAPKIPLLLYHGTFVERSTLSLCIQQKEDKLKVLPVVITSYDVFMRDHGGLQVRINILSFALFATVSPSFNNGSILSWMKVTELRI